MKTQLTKNETGMLARLLFNEIITMHELEAQGSEEWAVAKTVLNILLESQNIVIHDNLPF